MNKRTVLHIFLHPGKFHFELMNAERVLGINSIGLYYTTRHTPLESIEDPLTASVRSNIRLRRSPLFFYSRIRDAGRRCIAEFESHLPDLIYAHMLFSDGSIALDFYESFGIPYIVAIRNMDINSWYLWQIPQIKKRGLRVLLSAEKIVFLSPAYRTRLLELLPDEIRNYIASKSVISNNGVSDYWHIHKREKLKKIGPSIRVLTVGDICCNKNQAMVVRALEILREKGLDYTYSIIGNRRGKLRSRDLALLNEVNILPFCDSEKLRDYYEASDIFIMPSLHETFGLVYAEAMTQGLPVIYTENEGFDRQFLPGEVGYPVNPYQALDIANAIEKVVTNYELLSENCIKLSEKFQWSEIAAKYWVIYKDIWAE